MSKEIRVPHHKLSNAQTVGKQMDLAFEQHGLRKSVNIAEKVEDDPVKKQRIVKIKNTRYFGPWSHRG